MKPYYYVPDTFIDTISFILHTVLGDGYYFQPYLQMWQQRLWLL